jgi:hypothetical protein
MKLISIIAAATAVFASMAMGQGIGGRVADRRAVPGAKAKAAPRLPDGRPDLGNGKGVWNPRTIVNLSGIGTGGPNRSPVEKTIEVPFQPWAKALYDERRESLQKNDPEARCLPPGIPRMTATPFPFQIFQQPDRIVIVFEGGAHVWRQIYTDGREHPKNLNPTFLGHSIGRWEGDTLVVDAVGFNEQTWLDQDGHPHTEALHVVERYTRLDEDTLRYEVTIDDPRTYSAPWTTSYRIPWAGGEELLEYICQENNRDLDHMVGK